VFLGLFAATCGAQTARQWTALRAMMVETDVAAAGIKNPAVLAVMRSTPRHEFMPAEVRPYAYVDMALPIGEHQTISPPFMVAWMTQQLDPLPTDRVLEVGTGSGYQAAVLSGLVKEVYTIEIVEVLADRAAKTFQRLKYKNIEAKLGDGYLGWAEHAPFDKIIVTCSPEKIPKPLVEQLREGGRLIIPLGERYQQTLFVMRKVNGKLVTESREPTFFVPMTGKAETLRMVQTGDALSPLINGDFEQLLEADKPAGWYYLRQATIEEGGRPAGSKQCITFRNRVPGRNGQALQAIGIDGRQVSELVCELWLKTSDVEAGASEEYGAKVSLNFFDEDRVPLGVQVMGPWTGTLDWQRRSAHLKVPPTARVGIIAIGLLGATGELSCDQVTLRMANPRSASR
jgi:protein-L-isoaspartate(D-aspartate) O-methyltransferase